MDITDRYDKILSFGDESMCHEEGISALKKLVIDILDEIVEAGYEVGGMGEYGKGWNDSQEQMKMGVEEVKKKWTS